LLAAPVASDYGHIVTGPSLLLRYNYVQPGCRLNPYTQVGAGVVYTDAYRDQSQAAIGESVEFLLQGGVGCRYVLSPHWSADIEGEYQHISNGRLASRNLGVNNVGLSIGLTYYFPAGCR
jgi:opacity protein-like surface antigen